MLVMQKHLLSRFVLLALGLRENGLRHEQEISLKRGHRSALWPACPGLASAGQCGCQCH